MIACVIDRMLRQLLNGVPKVGDTLETDVHCCVKATESFGDINIRGESTFILCGKTWELHMCFPRFKVRRTYKLGPERSLLQTSGRETMGPYKYSE